MDYQLLFKSNQVQPKFEVKTLHDKSAIYFFDEKKKKRNLQRHGEQLVLHTNDGNHIAHIYGPGICSYNLPKEKAIFRTKNSKLTHFHVNINIESAQAIDKHNQYWLLIRFHYSLFEQKQGLL